MRWLPHARDLTRRPLDRDRRCGVLVVGAGITGALMAQHLASLGHGVCVIDRERPGLGSTAARTAMLLWEMLTTLTAIYGFEHAARVYRQSLAAVAGLQELGRTHLIPCSFRPRSSLYLAAGNHGARELLADTSTPAPPPTIASSSGARTTRRSPIPRSATPRLPPRPDARWPAIDRGRARPSAHARGLWLWRQRHHPSATSPRG